MKTTELTQHIIDHAQQSAKAIEAFFTGCADDLARLAVATVEGLATGKKVIVFGNGGSAADAQHLAAELMGRFLTERQPLPAVALTTNTSSLTAIGNDYGFDVIFDRQLRALAVAGDIVIGISTSGNSENVLRALESARAAGCITVGLTGESGGKIAPLCDYLFRTPTGHTPNVQECHIGWVHAYCDLIDRLWDLHTGDAPGGLA